MKQFAIIVGIIFYIFGSCHALFREYDCTYQDGRILRCESCCVDDCCEPASRLSGGAIAAIIFGVVVALALKVWCFCCFLRQRYTYRRCTIVTTVPRTVGVTNSHHAGYDQDSIPTIHPPNPRSPTNNQQQVFTGQQTNPNPRGYDQQKPNFEPIPPSPYDSLIKDSQK